MIHHTNNAEGWAMVQLSPSSDDDIVVIRSIALNILDLDEEEIR